jgi:DNA topoisomerase-1
MHTLIVAEKPSVANRIAQALADEGGAERKKGEGKASYYEIKSGGKQIYIAAAVGHIFTIRQSSAGRGYPVLDVEWAPSYKVSKGSEFTKDYYDTLKSLAAKSDRFINACDYDIEGTVIGTNIIRFTKEDGLKHSSRMKFSTTTDKDLRSAYKNMHELDMGNFYAGEARHMLDWLWGINLSRALTGAVGMGRGQSLSIGRVQGPALAMLAKREIDISSFVSRPFWRVSAALRGTEFLNTKGDMFSKADAERALEETQKSGKGIVSSVDMSKDEVKPFPPFDLTSLQLEASRALRMDPSTTLAVAQALYERSYISYPRTSSQKLPAALGLPEIITELSKNPEYRDRAMSLIREKRFVPLEGQKTDEAHPAIFPTGEMPSGMSDVEASLYDIIASRFLSCFAPNAQTERVKVMVSFGSQTYAASGRHVTHRGWLDFYKYAKLEETEMPAFAKGERVSPDKTEMKEMKTQPPKRYSKAGAIAELEKRNLGTKATRAAIIDTLFRRKYIDGASISVTKFGLSVYDALEKNCSMIVSEDTTRKLEEDMDGIALGKKGESEVIEEGKAMLLEALDAFDKHREQIAQSMRSSLVQMDTVGVCPVDKGQMVIRWSKIGRRFAGCSNYPNCTRTYPLPQKLKISGTGKNCQTCGAPIILIFPPRAKAFEFDINPDCPEKIKNAAAMISGQQPQNANANEAKTGEQQSAPAQEAHAAPPTKAKRQPGAALPRKKPKKKGAKNAKKQE